MVIFKVQTYQYSTYSYNGLTENESFYFTDEPKALKFIADNKYKLVNYVDKDNEVTLEQVTVN